MEVMQLTLFNLREPLVAVSYISTEYVKGETTPWARYFHEVRPEKSAKMLMEMLDDMGIQYISYAIGYPERYHSDNEVNYYHNNGMMPRNYYANRRRKKK